MYTRGLIPWNYMELAETVPIDAISESSDKPTYSLCLVRASATCTHNTLDCIWMYMKAQTKVEASSPPQTLDVHACLKNDIILYAINTKIS